MVGPLAMQKILLHIKDFFLLKVKFNYFFQEV
jgi:hypothetical protein